MKTISILFAIAVSAAFSSTAFSLTVDEVVTPEFVREHPEEFSITVRKAGNGLLEFTIIRFLPEPKYLVAHLSINYQGKLVAESHTPLFGKQDKNVFHFSISPDFLSDSKFEIGESAFRNETPLPGTKNYQFRLLDFVDEDAAEPAKKE